MTQPASWSNPSPGYRAFVHVEIERRDTTRHHRVTNASYNRLDAWLQTQDYDKAMGLGFDWVYSLHLPFRIMPEEHVVVSIKFPER